MGDEARESIKFPLDSPCIVCGDRVSGEEWVDAVLNGMDGHPWCVEADAHEKTRASLAKVEAERDDARSRVENAESVLRLVLSLQDWIPHEVVRDAERYFDEGERR